MLRCHDLQCTRPLWREGPSRVRAVSAEFSAARFYAVCGAAGCGKNLLLHLLGLLEQPDAGEVWLENTNASRLAGADRDALRLRRFGFLFPAFGLLPSLSVLENIAFPVLKAGGTTESEQADHTLFALQFCQLEDDAETHIGDLAPERQAVAAFARAIVHRPSLLIAETPSAEEILVPLARRAVDELGLTVIWGARPEGPAVEAAGHVLRMTDGRIETA